MVSLRPARRRFVWPALGPEPKEVVLKPSDPLLSELESGVTTTVGGAGTWFCCLRSGVAGAEEAGDDDRLED
jgi:hypothetical protein